MKKISLFIFIVIVLLCSCENKHYNEWIEKDGDKYYYNEQGQKQTGWLKDGSSWYYLDATSGKMLKNKWIDSYYVDGQGKMLVNVTRDISGETYVFNSLGIATKIEPYQLIIDCSFPKTFRSGGGKWHEIVLENVTYEVINKSNEKYFRVYYTGSAGNTSNGSNYSIKRSVGWKLYDPDNIVIESGDFHTDAELKYGEKFYKNYGYSWDPPIEYYQLEKKGTYRLQLRNYEYWN